MRHTVPLAGLGLVALVLLAGLVLAASAGAHVVDGTYRSDVTAENCGQYDACSGQAGNSSDSAPSGSSDGELASIRACESKGSGGYSANTGNGYYGAYQFDLQTWRGAGGSGNPADASPAEQDRIAASHIANGNRGAWPNC